MKRWMIVLGVVAALTAVSTGVAFAADEAPPFDGIRGGFGRYGANTEERPAILEGIMHENLINAVAEATELSTTELESRIEAGETLGEIVVAEGLTLEDLQAIMTEVRETALEDTVAEGLITQTQADRMLDRQTERGNELGDCDGPASDPIRRGGGRMGRSGLRSGS